jgi:hypothetical protein
VIDKLVGLLIAGEIHAPGRRPDLRKRVERAQQT